MPIPCEAKSEINEIRKTQGVQGESIAVVKEATVRLSQEQAAFISESREVIGLLKEMSIESKSGAKQAKENQDLLFTKLRGIQATMSQLKEEHIEERAKFPAQVLTILEPSIKPIREDVKVLMDDKNSRETKSILLRDMRVTIPVFCTLSVTLILLWEKLHNWLKP